MNQEITKPQKCIVMRNGAEIWIDEDKANELEIILANLKESKFIFSDGRTFNTADISNILLPEDMEDITRRKNGQWKCKYGHWHERGEQCSHGFNGLEKYKKY
ncbi:MAG: hypothetical protein PHO58_04730 [Bacilli bacterium]|nr:hypothetical protein [Bacilli bacterium]